MINNLKKYSLLTFSLLFCAIYIVPKGYAAFVTPTRVFIYDGRTTASVSIANRSDEVSIYTFEWERRARSKDGKSTHILKDGETFEGYHPADPYLVYSPRRVVVAPGETQRVRIFARRTKDMAPGEYRSHLRITSDSITPPEKGRVGRGEFGGTLAIRPAMSIPVMLRTGKTKIDVKITGVNIRQEGAGNVDVIYLDMANNSTRSIYGKSIFKCKTSDSEEILSAKSNGFRLYYETETLNEGFQLPDVMQLSKCTSLDIELYSVRDPEYRNEPIAIAKVK